MREKEKERERGERYRKTVYVGDWKKNKERRRERHNSVAVSKRRSSYSASVLDGIIELYVFSLSIHNGVNSRILR